MKKSNRVFIALIATLYIVPALTFGVAQFTSEKCLTGFTQKFQIIQIDILYYWLVGRGTPGKIKISRCISVSTISRRSV